MHRDLPAGSPASGDSAGIRRGSPKSPAEKILDNTSARGKPQPRRLRQAPKRTAAQIRTEACDSSRPGPGGGCDERNRAAANAADVLNSWEGGVLASIGYLPRLSPKQLACLQRIFNKVCAAAETWP
jgi:hypothetical protein